MPPPPPPPPPALQINSEFKQPSPAPVGDRNALLSQIRHGAKLKKAVTNDRSLPLVNGKSSKNAPAGQECPSTIGKNRNVIGMAGLFAEGMPKLKSINSSFLQGGTYKSQLNTRQLSNKDTTKNHIINKSCDDLSVSDSARPSMQPSLQNRNVQGFASEISSKAKSFQNLNVSTKEMSQKSVSSSELNFRPTCPRPPPASKKPNLNTQSVPQNGAVKSFLHSNDDDDLGGSMPNLNGNFIPRPRVSSKPLPPPSKPNINRRSYEDSDIPNNMESKRESAKLNDRSLKYNTMRNASKTNNLFVNNSFGPSPMPPQRRSAKRERPIKPSVAPPPLPVRINGLTQSHAHTLTPAAREPPPRAPINVPPTPVPPPPPPPPRVVQQSVTTLRRQNATKCMPMQSEKGMVLKSDFEGRFIFRGNFELPRPEPFKSKGKSYPSRFANARQNNGKKMCHPPPMAPPPPPPPHHGM